MPIARPLWLFFLLTILLFSNLQFHPPILSAATPANHLKAESQIKPISSFEELNRLMSLVNDHRLPEVRILLRIQNTPLTFRLSYQQFELLKSAGASEKLQKVLQPYVDPKPPEPKGTLTVLCDPIDCNIIIDNGKDPKLSGITEKGKSLAFSLTPGTYTVKATAHDYEPDKTELPVSIQDKTDQQVAFRFVPSHEALATAGKRIYEQVVGALGGESVMKNSSLFKANGTLNLSDRDGKQSQYEFTVLFKAPDTARFTVTRANKAYNVLYTGHAGYKWDKIPADAPSLEDVLMRTCQFQIANLLRRFGSPPFELVSRKVAPEAGNGASIRAESSPDTYVISVDRDFHVNDIKIESPGLNNGVRALYGDYGAQSNCIFARTTQILLADGPKHGVDLHYSEIIYHPANMGDEYFATKTGKRGQLIFLKQF